MDNVHITRIAEEYKLGLKQVAATVDLLDNDATVPFIARYRKEATGSLEDVTITAVRDRIAQLRELDKRRHAIMKSLEKRGLLTDELKEKLISAETMAALEDIYLPFRPKKRTRATIARERGLEPLAEILFAQDDIDPSIEAEPFVDSEKGVETVEDALAGARDIVAEWVNEDTGARERMRELFDSQATFRTKVSSGKEIEGTKYSDYFDWEEAVSVAPSHRVLAMRRAEAESIITLHIAPPEEAALSILEEIFVISGNRNSEQVRMAVHDSYRRLLGPAMETEIRTKTKELADQEAIRVFADNLRELLMTPPLGRKNILAIDPGFRTGCKIVCLDRQGTLKRHATVQPHASKAEREDAATTIKALCERFRINVIAIGNGTGGRETEAFIRGLGLSEHIMIEMISEAGASVYSASEAAREEFPDHDVTVRGAISIGRRLMDPLAELVKIDPKSIGVGQYQHDVDQASLKQGLDDTVIGCVNNVGVDVNTASRQLLTYISGLGPRLAKNIVIYREENGPFKSRAQLKKVPRLGPKAFEQAAGFMRITNAGNPLDKSAVHPESYSVVGAMAADIGCTINQLMQNDDLRQRVNLGCYVSDKVGMPTLQDIMDELARPGRDPRDDYETFSYDESVNKIEDLKAGMKLPGIVTNVTAFGAFVDIGVHHDGLVHISELADKYVKDPSDVIKVQQKVLVTVLDIDLDRKRIALSMRETKGGQGSQTMH
ncbi:MAG: Tex family protein [candidate division Zixibacteria bacterium]|nr:Tex family protein [candidate division Zixibacteria bacterium]